MTNWHALNGLCLANHRLSGQGCDWTDSTLRHHSHTVRLSRGLLRQQIAGRKSVHALLGMLRLLPLHMLSLLLPIRGLPSRTMDILLLLLLAVRGMDGLRVYSLGLLLGLLQMTLTLLLGHLHDHLLDMAGRNDPLRGLRGAGVTHHRHRMSTIHPEVRLWLWHWGRRCLASRGSCWGSYGNSGRNWGWCLVAVQCRFRCLTQNVMSALNTGNAWTVRSDTVGIRCCWAAGAKIHIETRLLFAFKSSVTWNYIMKTLITIRIKMWNDEQTWLGDILTAV